MPHLIFHRASGITDPRGLNINPEYLPLISSVLNKFEVGSVYLIEGSNTKEIHRQLHAIIFQASISGWKTKLIDAANSFNPQLLDELAQKNEVQTSDVLNAIEISRPFQMFQAASIIENLSMILKGNTGNLIAVTEYPSMFFDQSTSQAQDSGFTAGELFYHSTGLLQRMALEGNIVIFTERVRTSQDSMLSFTANVHLRVDKVSPEYDAVHLLSHPTLNNKTVKQQIKKTKQSVQQMSLEDFF